jgi:hypothetical protein
MRTLKLAASALPIGVADGAAMLVLPASRAAPVEDNRCYPVRPLRLKCPQNLYKVEDCYGSGR